MTLPRSPGTCPLLLVTGFGPFPRARVNPSAGLARAVAASPRWRLAGAEARALVLETTYACLDAVFEPALRGPPAPAAVLMMGLALRAKRVRVEGRATRRPSPLLPDAAGRNAKGRAATPGPAARRTRLSVPAVVACLERHRVACRPSHEAGRYLCNAAYYRALAGAAPVLFLHVPAAPRPGRRRLPGELRARERWAEHLARAFVVLGVELLARARRAEGRGGRSVAASRPGS